MIGKTPTKVISFNSNYCVAFNFHSWVQWSDPGHEIEWLENELHELEKVGGAAILLSHVPNIHQCVRNFGMRWHALMDRYQHVIRWTMAAHNHIQSWNIERSMFTQQPIMMNYIIGSTTPWSPSQVKKPTFVVMEMDPDSLIPVNLVTYSFDIKHANEFNEPKWDLDYDFKKVYNLPDLSPKSFSKYAAKMATNERAAQIFRNHMNRGYWAEDDFSPCDGQCRRDTMCYAVSNDYDDAQHCSGYSSWELIPHGKADGLAPVHSLFPNLWSRSWWRKTAKAK